MLSFTVVICFRYLRSFCIDLAISDIDHYVETAHEMQLLLTSFRNHFKNICDAQKTANLEPLNSQFGISETRFPADISS